MKPPSQKQTPLGGIDLTQREFELIRFQDRYGSTCSIQQSSIFDEEYADKPGATAIWLGRDWQEGPRDGIYDQANTTRMHLDRKQVKNLIAVLEMWLQTGRFAE